MSLLATTSQTDRIARWALVVLGLIYLYGTMTLVFGDLCNVDEEAHELWALGYDQQFATLSEIQSLRYASWI